MPYRSEAQRKKFHAMLSKGEISPEVVKEYDKASQGMLLPERVSKRGKKKIKSIGQIRKLSSS